ncbi:DUF6841 family protein [Ottowia thiooxydans]|uniref:DUF6841 domain-containing protein n=1 Tax=Ottowia thiooxydans TaxID=219182 RepID=A0ABV2QCX4_9BURK
MHSTTPSSPMHAEINQWFFHDYLPTWIAAGASGSGDDSNFIAQYWGSPLHISSDAYCGCKLTSPEVIAFLNAMHERLRFAGYAHTDVLDKRIKVLSKRGGSIEVIWSRQRADGSEIERILVHFHVVKTDQGWRVLAYQSTKTTSTTLKEAWLELNPSESAAA